MTHLAFVQPYVPEYRIPFFQKVTEGLSSYGMTTDIVVSRRQGSRRDGAVSYPQVVAKDSLSRLTRDRLRWRSGVVPPRRGYCWELVIVEDALRNLDSLPLLSAQYVGGPGVAMWGHGRTFSSCGRLRDKAKAHLARRSEWYFAYTESGAAALAAAGFPLSRITVIRNTVDTHTLKRNLEALRADQVASFMGHHGLVAGHTAMFIGGLDEHKGVEALVPLACEARRRDPEFVLLIAGDGPARAELVEAARCGAPVRVMGRLTGAPKALAMQSASALVIPRGIGLVAVEALVAGLPIVSTQAAGHGPEEEYLTESSHAVRLASHDPADLGRAVSELLASPQRLFEMQEACRRSASDHSMDDMVGRTIDGVLAWREIHEHGLGH